MLSVGVTASRDSVTPAPKPASTVRGPLSLPSASASKRLYWSKATNPALSSALYHPCTSSWRQRNVRMPALAEFPIMSVVHPAYHCFPNGGHGSFLPSANRLLSWDLVFATVFLPKRSDRSTLSASLSSSCRRQARGGFRGLRRTLGGIGDGCCGTRLVSKRRLASGAGGGRTNLNCTGC